MRRSLSEAQHALGGLGELVILVLGSGAGVFLLLCAQIFFRKRALSILVAVLSLVCIIATLWLMHLGWRSMLGIPLALGLVGLASAVVLLRRAPRQDKPR